MAIRIAIAILCVKDVGQSLKKAIFYEELAPGQIENAFDSTGWWPRTEKASTVAPSYAVGLHLRSSLLVGHIAIGWPRPHLSSGLFAISCAIAVRRAISTQDGHLNSHCHPLCQRRWPIAMEVGSSRSDQVTKLSTTSDICGRAK